MVDVAVIVPAAGRSERFDGNTVKQYVDIEGKPLFSYCLETFLKTPYVRKISLVVDNTESAELLISNLFPKKIDKIICVVGGASRHDSIRNGLTALLKTDLNYKIVLVHDAARPLISQTILDELVEAALIHGAAGVTRPLTSTVLRPDNCNCLEESLVRSLYVSSETPQAFQTHVLDEAYKKCSKVDLENGTECLDLVLKYCGVRAKLIPGPECLWKVTYKKDLHTAVGCIRELNLQVCVITEHDSDVIQLLLTKLRPKVSRVDSIITGDNSKLTQNDNTVFNTIVCFHVREIDERNQLLDFATVLDIEKKGLIIHVVEHSTSDGMQSTSVYELHRSGRNLARNYEKLKKGVVMIHCLSQGEETRLVDLIISLIMADTHTFSGQTLFL